MSKNAEQMAFLADFACLLNYAVAYAKVIDAYVVAGELHRSDETQKMMFDKGLSQIEGRGQHGERMAGDLYLIKDGKMMDVEGYRPLGVYWKSLSPGLNRWGGDWSTLVDAPHFERRYQHARSTTK